MDAIGAFLEFLPPQMREPVLFAIPFFLLLLILEWTAARKLEHLESGDQPPAGAYVTRDAWTSLAMGLVSVGTMAVWKLGALIGYAALYTYVAPWQLPSNRWYTWVIAIVGVDLLFYCYHRTAHRVRLIWATHQAHHSSEYYNFATALRQKWNNSHELVFWAPLPVLGVPPALVFLGFSVSLVYQFFVHTERVRTLWRPIELVFNTPSHHRVHHGSDPEYLDRNYGGILIVWDRLFGTFQAEQHRPTYGLTTPVGTHNLLRLQTHEYAAIARDVRAAPTLRQKLGYVFGPPGWRPQPAAVEPVAPSLVD